MRKARKFIAVLFLVVLTAGITVSSSVALREASKPAREALERDRVRVTTALANRVSNWIESAERQAGGLAAGLTPWNPRDVVETRARLDRSLETADLLDAGAYVVDREGQVVGASSVNAGTMGLRRDGEHVTGALDGKTTMSSILVEPLRRVAVIAIASPVVSRGEIAAAVVGLAALDASSLGTLGESLDLQSNAAAYLVDPSGTVLDGRTASGDLHRAGPDIAPGADLARTSQRSGFLRHKGEGSLEIISAYAHAGGRWSVVITETASDFYAPTEKPVVVGTATVLAILVALLGIATFFYSKWKTSIRRSEASKKAFLAVAGHELRTPLTVIRGFGQTLLSKWDRMEESQKKEILQTIGLQARNLEHLVERLMVASQLDAGIAGRPSIRSTDIVPILSKATEHHQSLSVIHDIVLETPEVVWAEIDTKFFQQAIDHLIENAIKFSPSGGEIRVLVVPNGKSVAISVEDQGVGLPSDSSGIFEKFSQTERVETRTHEEGGVGLGLYIVRSLVERMGGSVEARPRTSGGARFVVRVPAAPGSPDSR